MKPTVPLVAAATTLAGAILAAPPRPRRYPRRSRGGGPARPADSGCYWPASWPAIPARWSSARATPPNWDGRQASCARRGPRYGRRLRRDRRGVGAAARGHRARALRQARHLSSATPGSSRSARSRPGRLGLYQTALDTMALAPVRLALTALPVMRHQGHGRIVTIASVGGKLSVPHLLPYSTAKFAAVGFSERLAPNWAAAR